MIQTPELESMIAIINWAQDEDKTPSAAIVAARYVASCAVASGRPITIETIENDLDSLLEHGARFNYGEACDKLSKAKNFLIQLNKWVEVNA